MKFQGEGYVPRQGKSLRVDEFVIKGDFRKYRGREYDVSVKAKDKDAAIRHRKGKAYLQKYYKNIANKIQRLKKKDLLKIENLGLQTLAEQVAAVMRRNETTRDDDGLLIAEVYHVFYGAVLKSNGAGSQNITLDVSKLLKGLKKGGYPAPASIIRVRCHLQSLGFYLPSPLVRKAREQAQENYRKTFAG